MVMMSIKRPIKFWFYYHRDEQWNPTVHFFSTDFAHFRDDCTKIQFWKRVNHACDSVLWLIKKNPDDKCVLKRNWYWIKFAHATCANKLILFFFIFFRIQFYYPRLVFTVCCHEERTWRLRLRWWRYDKRNSTSRCELESEAKMEEVKHKQNEQNHAQPCCWDRGSWKLNEVSCGKLRQNFVRKRKIFLNWRKTLKAFLGLN